MSEDRRGRPLDGQRDQLIHNMTLKLMGEIGYDALSIESVAKQAGVSKATIYRRYPNKMEMVLGSLEHNLSDPPMPNTGNGLNDLQLMAKLIVTYALNDRARCMFGCMMVARSRHPELAEAMRKRVVGPRRARGKEVIDRTISRGELPQDTPVELLMDMIFGPLFIRHARGDEVSESDAATLVEKVWLGMGGQL
jgi:AcrR family transcriptional regulator